MLEVRPTCENCNRPLAPNATDAMICSYECTFWRDCVDAVLSNVCPNCGGGFERRPVRPAHAWIEGAPREPFPPSTNVVHKPVDPTAHEALVALIGGPVTLAALTPCALRNRSIERLRGASAPCSRAWLTDAGVGFSEVTAKTAASCSRSVSSRL
jgi:uncharacterized protein